MQCRSFCTEDARHVEFNDVNCRQCPSTPHHIDVYTSLLLDHAHHTRTLPRPCWHVLLEFNPSTLLETSTNILKTLVERGGRSRYFPGVSHLRYIHEQVLRPMMTDTDNGSSSTSSYQTKHRCVYIALCRHLQTHQQSK